MREATLVALTQSILGHFMDCRIAVKRFLANRRLASRFFIYHKKIAKNRERLPSGISYPDDRVM
ncbi:hypothetical protein [Candidatus Tisiphia endosymbiont of Sialis lutaria]|uniref:hypothetical protein n=1 Tax=Candidatus Tisiphia endosymbiont of Sialis lutaria TaxID=2029164 RepID=UPI00312C764A